MEQNSRVHYVLWDLCKLLFVPYHDDDLEKNIIVHIGYHPITFLSGDDYFQGLRL